MKSTKQNNCVKKLMKQHKFKSVVALFLVFVLVMGLLPIEDATVDAWADNSQQPSNIVGVQNWEDLQSALGCDNSVIELRNNIEANWRDSALVVTGSAITIKMNNNDIDRKLSQDNKAATEAGFVLKVASGASITIIGANSGNNPGHIMGGNNIASGGAIVVESGGSLTLRDVNIGKSKASEGRGIYLEPGASLTLDGRVTMGGPLIENDSYIDIFLNGGTLRLGEQFDSRSKVYVGCDVGTKIFSEKVTDENAKAFYVYKSGKPGVRLSYDTYRNAFYLPNKVTEAPAAIAGLTYNKDDRTLITAGTASGGAIYYKNTEANSLQPDFIDASGEIAPGWVDDASRVKGQDAGTYRVWYAVKGDDSCCTVDPDYVDVEIAEAELEIEKEYTVSVVVKKWQLN